MSTRPASANSRTRAAVSAGASSYWPNALGRPGVGIRADARAGDAGEVGQERAHLAGAQRAVDADRVRPRVRDRHPEGLDRLAGQGASAAVGDRDRDHDGHPVAPRLEHLFDGHQRGLRVERVEDRLDQQQVAAAVEQPARLLRVGVLHLLEGDGPERRVVHVRRQGERPVGGADGARHEPRAVRRLRRPRPCRVAREARGLDVDVVHHVFEAVVGLGNRGAVEGARLDDVGPSLEIRVVDAADDVGPRQHEEVVVALEVARMGGEPLAAEIGLRQAVPLHHRPHRPVEDEDPAAEDRVEHVARSLFGHRGPLLSRGAGRRRLSARGPSRRSQS